MKNEAKRSTSVIALATGAAIISTGILLGGIEGTKLLTDLPKNISFLLGAEIGALFTALPASFCFDIFRKNRRRKIINPELS